MKNVMLEEPSIIVLFGMGFVVVLFLMALVGAVVFLIVRFLREKKNPASPHSPIPPVHPASGRHRFKTGLLLLLLAGMAAVICLVLLTHSQGSVEVLGQSEFFHAFESNRIVSATITFDAPGSSLVRITGTYKRRDQFNNETEARYVVKKALLTENMRDALLRELKPVEIREPNTHFMMNLIWTIIPFLIPFLMVVLMGLALGAIAFFVIRRTSKDGKVTQAPPMIPQTERMFRKCPQCGAELKPDVSEGLCPACLLQRGIATEGGAPPGTPPFVPPTIPDLAKLFPQLEILELIGKGGMGAVYKARQPSLDRFVALKILASRSGGDLDFAERFTREARALAKLSHPNIVAVYDFGRAELPLGQDAQQRVPTTPVHYFIMEYVDGPNLRQVEQAGRLSPREALEIIPQICGALQFAHDEGIVHRDIKPENVLLDKKGRVKIADFGLAKILGSEPKDFRLTGARDVVGTPHYMAPEQLEKPLTVDHRADIYSLGVVFYEMLTGELPLGKFQPPSSCARGMQIDVRLDEVVLHALEKAPERRYQQASQVKTAVETIAQTPAPSSSGRESAPSESQSQLMLAAARSPFRRGALAGFAVLLVIVVLAIGVTLLLPRNYVGVARVKLADDRVQHIQTECVEIQSSDSLRKVATDLKLGERWNKKYGITPNDSDAVEQLLRYRVTVESVRNTSLVEISVYDESASEAAEIANKISEVYCALHGGQIVSRSIRPLRPVKPNVPLNIFLGVVTGIGLGLLTGFVVGLFTFWRGRAARRTMSPPTIQKPDHFWRWFFAVVIACLVFIPVAIAILGLLAAIAIPNFVKGRNQALANRQERAVAVQQSEMASNLAFGPVVERVVTDVAENPQQAYLDFGSGEFRVPPPKIADGLRLIAVSAQEHGFPVKSPSDASYNWFKSNHVDLIGGELSRPTLIMLGEPANCYTVTDETFDTVQPSEIINLLQQPSAFPEDNPRFPSIHLNPMPLDTAPFSLAHYFFFRTQDGNAGVLEVLGASDNPPGVKIRYKLLQAVNSQVASPPVGLKTQP